MMQPFGDQVEVFNIMVSVPGSPAYWKITLGSSKGLIITDGRTPQETIRKVIEISINNQTLS
jgi:hypothetical protein